MDIANNPQKKSTPALQLWGHDAGDPELSGFETALSGAGIDLP
jgi:hypothetical protein